MPDALSSIGSFFGGGGGTAGGGLGDLLGLGTAGLGLFGNISGDLQRNQVMNQLKQAEAAEANLTPQALAAKVAAAQQPLNNNLVQSIGNKVSGSLASQGLSEAPGIQASTLAQALAPAEQQNQQAALQLVMQQMGLPIQYAEALLKAIPQSSSLAPILQMLMKQNQPSTGGGNGNYPGGSWDLLNSVYGSETPDSSGLDIPAATPSGGGISA